MSGTSIANPAGRHHAESMEKPRLVWSLLAEKGHYPTRLVSHAAPEELQLRRWTERIDAFVSAHFDRVLSAVTAPLRRGKSVTEFSVPEVSR